MSDQTTPDVNVGAPADAGTRGPAAPSPDPNGNAAADAADLEGAPESSPNELPAMPLPTPEEAAELRARAVQAEENWSRYLHAAADLENFKRRTARERQEAEKHRHEPLLRELLPVLDNLDTAFAAAQHAPGTSVEALEAGVAMICQQLKSVLAGVGLEEIDATGQVFDPKVHEAVSQQASAEVLEGQVLQQLRKGFKYRDRLLRPASVVVARKSEP